MLLHLLILFDFQDDFHDDHDLFKADTNLHHRGGQRHDQVPTVRRADNENAEIDAHGRIESGEEVEEAERPDLILLLLDQELYDVVEEEDEQDEEEQGAEVGGKEDDHRLNVTELIILGFDLQAGQRSRHFIKLF